LWATANAEWPQAKHNTAAFGAAWKNAGWEHLAQVTMNLANAESENPDYKGFLNMPVDVQMGHNFKASDATNF